MAGPTTRAACGTLGLLVAGSGEGELHDSDNAFVRRVLSGESRSLRGME